MNTLPELKFSELKALCEIMDCTPTELRDLIESGDWSIYTDEEADEAATEHIKDSLWAFTPNFLSSATELPIEVFEAIQNNNKCEDNNEAVLALVEKSCGLDSLVEEAIAWDGRGHFLSSYDGNEYEVGSYFVYRNN